MLYFLIHVEEILRLSLRVEERVGSDGGFSGGEGGDASREAFWVRLLQRAT